MSKLALTLPDPPPRERRTPSDKRQHPESHADDMRKALALRNEQELPKGWHWNFGYAVRLYQAPVGMFPPVRRNLFESTYEAAVRTRNAEMKAGKYEKAWIERLNE